MAHKMHLILISLLLCSFCQAATINVYVDTDESTGVQDGTQTNPYDCLADALRAKATNLTTAGNKMIINCTASSGTVDTNYAEVDSTAWTVDEVNDLTIQGDGTYILARTNTIGGLKIEDGFVHLIGMKFRGQGDTTAAITCLDYNHQTAGTYNNIDKCLFEGIFSGTTNSSIAGIYIADNDTVLNITNSIFKDFTHEGTVTFCRALIADPGGTITLQNCTIANCGVGIRRTAGTVTITNCAIFNNSDDINGTVTVTYSAGDDAEFDSGTGNIGWDNTSTSWNANFTNYSGGDFTIVNTSADIYHTGTDLGLSTDYSGYAWYTTPSIGAYEFQEAASKKPRIININMN